MGDLAKTAPTTAPKACGLGKILTAPNLDDDDRQALADVLDPASGISSNAATLWLRSNGFAVGHETTAAHRGGTCVCERS